MRFFKKSSKEDIENNGEPPLDDMNSSPVEEDMAATQTASPDGNVTVVLGPDELATNAAPAGANDSAELEPVSSYVGKHSHSSGGSGAFKAPAHASTYGSDTETETLFVSPDNETVFFGQASEQEQASDSALAAPPMTVIGDGFATDDGKKRRSTKFKVLLTVGIVVGVLVIAYVGVSIFFMSHFGFRTFIAGEDVSFKTVEEVEKSLSADAGDYVLTIQEREDKSETIDGADIGFAYDEKEGQVQAVLDDQEAFLWPMRLLREQEPSTEIQFSYDPNLLSEAINGLQCMLPENQQPPQNAYPEFNGTEYVAHPEVLGTTINADEINKAIPETVKYGVASISLSDANCYVPPEVTTTTPSLLERIQLLDKYVPFSLTYTMPDGSTVVLDGETVFNWLDVNPDDDSYTFREEEVVNWVDGLANRYDTVGHERVFNSVDGNTYSVSGGTYGWSIDEEAEVEAIENMLVTKQSETREPIWVSTAAVVTQGTEPDWGNTYIDLSIGNQHMYYIKDGEVIFEADVVTGLPGRDTPQGVWSILEMQRNKVLTGEMTAAGVPEYETPVAYWMRVTWSGVGFHDATWQSSFGGSRYLYAGSHGCINMDYYDAAALYDIAFVGLPVIIHA